MSIEQGGSSERLAAVLEMQQRMSPEKQEKIVDMLKFLREGEEQKVWAVGRVNRLMEMAAVSGEKINRGVGDSLVMMERNAFENKVEALRNVGAEITQIGGGDSRKLIRMWTEEGVEVVQEVLLVEPSDKGYSLRLGKDTGFELRGQVSSATANFAEGLSLPVFVAEDIREQYKEALTTRDLPKLFILEKFIDKEVKQEIEQEVGVGVDDLVYGSEEHRLETKVIRQEEIQAGQELYLDEEKKEAVGQWQTARIAYTYEDINAIIAHAQAVLYEHFQSREDEPISGTEAYLVLAKSQTIPNFEENSEYGTDRSTRERGQAILGVLPRIKEVGNLAELNEVLEKIVLDAMTFTRDQGNWRAFELQVCSPMERVDARRDRSQQASS